MEGEDGSDARTAAPGSDVSQGDDSVIEDPARRRSVVLGEVGMVCRPPTTVSGLGRGGRRWGAGGITRVPVTRTGGRVRVVVRPHQHVLHQPQPPRRRAQQPLVQLHHPAAGGGLRHCGREDGVADLVAVAAGGHAGLAPLEQRREVRLRPRRVLRVVRVDRGRHPRRVGHLHSVRAEGVVADAHEALA